MANNKYNKYNTRINRIINLDKKKKYIINVLLLIFFSPTDHSINDKCCFILYNFN